MSSPEHPVPARDDVRADDLVQRVQAGLAVGVRDGGGQVVAWSVRHATAMVAAALALRVAGGRRSRGSVEGVLERLLGFLVQRRLADPALVATHRPDEQADVTVLDQEEQRRATGRQVVCRPP